MRRNWNKLRPTSQSHAIRLCWEFANEKKNLSVARIAELIGKSEWCIYDWAAKGSMPSKHIRPYEHICGATFITQYIATSAHKILIDVPNGRTPKDNDILGMQSNFNDAANLLVRFYRGEAEASETITALGVALKEVAQQRENVRQHAAPELSLFDDGEAET